MGLGGSTPPMHPQGDGNGTNPPFSSHSLFNHSIIIRIVLDNGRMSHQLWTPPHACVFLLCVSLSFVFVEQTPSLSSLFFSLVSVCLSVYVYVCMWVADWPPRPWDPKGGPPAPGAWHDGPQQVRPIYRPVK